MHNFYQVQEKFMVKVALSSQKTSVNVADSRAPVLIKYFLPRNLFFANYNIF